MQQSLFERMEFDLPASDSARPDVEYSDDLEVGKAAEHLVCADLIMSGYRAFLSDQGLPYDILVDVDGALLRVQVKSTRKPKNHDPRTRATPGYFFHLRRAGKGGRRRYPENALTFTPSSRSIGRRSPICRPPTVPIKPLRCAFPVNATSKTAV